MKALRFQARVFLLLTICALGWAQSTSQIQGTVHDPAGAAVPGAEVKATQTDTGAVRTTTTGADGVYVLANLPIGPYRMEVTKAGFSTYAQTGIVLQVAVNPTVDFALKIGTASESIQVEANTTQVETQATGVGQVLENQRILELPLNGRNTADLVTMAGPVVLASTSTSRSWQGTGGGEGFSVAGGTSFGTSYRLDGSMHNNPFDNFNMPLPFPDALQEFKVETSALTAQNGVHSGASINAVTKSGTNNFHGDAFEFIRNGVLDARNFFGAARDTLKRNQFGGTVGGPIMHNKLFFFAGFQGTTTRTAPPTNFAFVPTAAMLAGDFSAYAGAGCQGGTGKQLLASAGFDANNHISPSKLSPAAVAIATKYLPKTSDPCGKTFFSIPTNQNEMQGVARGDYQVSDKQTLFARYIATTYHQPIPNTLNPSVLATTTGGRDNLAQTYSFGDTFLISPTTVNSFRAAYNRTAIARAAIDDFGPVDVGINAFSYTPHYMLLAVGTGGGAGGGFTIGNGTESNSNFRGNTYEIGNDVSLVRGAHQIVIGGDVAMWNSASYALVRAPGTYSFDNHFTGLVLSDFLLGALGGNGLDQAEPNTLFTRQEYLGIYAQDTWKVSQHLTLNYGLRWEPWFPVSVTNGANMWFSMQRFTAGTKSTVFPNAPAGIYYGGDPGFPDSSVNKRWGNLAPRVGLAWDPKGDGRMTLRASWGEFFDYPNGQQLINMTIGPPFGDETRTGAGVAGSLDNPWKGIPGGNPFPVSSDPNKALFVQFGPYLSLDPQKKNTAVNSWNLTLQKQIGVPWLVTASYIGSETAHLWLTNGLNPSILPAACLGADVTKLVSAPPPGCPSNVATTTNARRLLNQINPTVGGFYGFVDGVNDGGTQSYNALLTSVQRRLAKGVSFNANYTWSHCLSTDHYGHGGGTMNVANTYLNPASINYDKGPCGTDRRHIFNLSGVAQMPRFNNTALRVVASGWQVAMIVRYQSGAPLNIFDQTDNLLNGVAQQRPNLVLANTATTATGCTPAPCVPFLNPAAFKVPGAGVLGSLGALSVYGPSFSEIDMSISRSFKLREYLRMDIRGDAFNLPNSMRPGGSNQGAGTVTTPVNSTFGSGTFGTITNAYDPRILQMSAKFVF